MIVFLFSTFITSQTPTWENLRKNCVFYTKSKVVHIKSLFVFLQRAKKCQNFQMQGDFYSHAINQPRSLTPKVCHTFVEEYSPKKPPYEIFSDSDSNKIKNHIQMKPKIINEPTIPQQKRNFLPPILAQSPRVRDEDDEDIYMDDDIYPEDIPQNLSPTGVNKGNDNFGGGLSNKFGQTRLLNINEFPAAFIDTSSNESSPQQSPRPLPQDSPDPSYFLLDIQLHEAKANLRNAVNEWRSKINNLKAQSRLKMEQLLERHADELSNFDKKNGFGRMNTSPQLLELIGCDRENTDPSVYRVRTIASPKRTHTPITNNFKTMEFNQKRKNMIDRHKHEIIALNNECSASLKALEEKRDADLEKKKQIMQNLAQSLPGNNDLKPSFSGIDFNATIKLSPPQLFNENGERKERKYFRISPKDKNSHGNNEFNN